MKLMTIWNGGEMPDCGGGDDKMSSTRELALVLLEQLYINFEQLSRLGEAGPLLDRLTAIAYAAERRTP